MLVPWYGFIRSRFGYVLPVGEASGLDAPVRLGDFATTANSAVGDGAPHFASQVSASQALVDRLNRDRVQHAPDDDRPKAA